MVGAAWFMTALGASSQLIALVQTASTLPIVLFSLWTGALADNHDRRLIMLWSQIFMLVVSAALAVCASLGWLTPWLLLIFTFLISCGMAFKIPAISAAIGDMVARPALPAAVAMNSMGFNAARSVGPAIGGVIVTVLGAASAFAINAATYIALIVVLMRWRPPPPPPGLPSERLGAAVSAGLRYVAMSPDLRTVFIRAGAFSIGASATPALMPLVARDLVGGGALAYGVLLGAFGVGAVVGAFWTASLRKRHSNEFIVCVAALALAGGAAASALSPWIVATMIALAFAGAGWVVALSTFNVTVQLASPRWVVARTLSVYQLAAFAGLAGGAAAFGWLAEHHGVAMGLLAASVVQVGGVLLGLVCPLAVTAGLDLDPLDRFTAPRTVVPVDGRSGPVEVTLEYRIPEDRVAAFLQAMTERRRIRRRDGAQDWRLLRDIGEDDLWIERYRVATWLDYLRHNQRPTKADLANLDRLRSLHDREGPIKVHRMIERPPGAGTAREPGAGREYATIAEI